MGACLKHYGLLLLGIWLVALSLQQLTGLQFSHDQKILAILALASGVLLLIHELKARLEYTGVLLLGIWLLLKAIMTLFGIKFAYSEPLLAVLAGLSGVFLIFRK